MIDLALARQVLELALADYSRARAEYWARVFDEVFNYLGSAGAVTAFKNVVKRAMLEAFTDVANIAWQDGGAELPLEADANSWLTSRMNEESGYIDNTFESLKLLRQDEGDNAKLIAGPEASRRADGYAKTLDIIYNTIKTLAAGAMMLTFVGADGAESCADCQRYKNKRHKASWWVAHDAVPPNRNFECHGYRCEHILVDDKGRVFTL